MGVLAALFVGSVAAQAGMGVLAALVVAAACRFGLPLVYQIVAGLTVVDLAVFVAMACAAAVQYVQLSKAKDAAPAATAPAPAKRRATRVALAPGTDAVSLELEACLSRAAQGEMRAPFELLGSLHAAGVVRPAHVARVLSEGFSVTQIRDALKFAQLAKVVLDNDAVVAVLNGLCDMDAGDTALDVWRSVAGREYYLPAPCLEALLTAAIRHGAHADAEELFRHVKRVSTPSGRAYASAIFAHGCRGDVTGCLDLYDEVQVEREDDHSPAWNSLLVSLVRNGCSGRAAQLFAAGREHMNVLPIVSRAVMM